MSWNHYPPVARELRPAGQSQPGKPKSCSSEERILGFCT
jgi:hypothetical protein